MHDLLIQAGKMLAMLLPFLLLAWMNAKANLKRQFRSRQFLMPLLAVLYCLAAVIFLSRIYNLTAEILARFPQWIAQLGAWVTQLAGGKLSGLGDAVARLGDMLSGWFAQLNLLFWAFFVANWLLLFAHVVLKRILVTFLKLIFKSGGGLHELAAGLFYELDEENGVWHIQNRYGQARTLLRTFYIGAVAVSVIAAVVSCGLYRNGLLSAPFYPAFGVIIIGELYFFLNGLTKKEAHDQITREKEDAENQCDYSLLRSVLRKLFPDKLNAENTTVNDGLTRFVTNDEFLTELEGDDTPSVEAYGRFMRAKTAAGLELDQNYLRSGLQLLNGESVLFNNPFYYDLIPYIFYPMNRTMLRRRKVLIILGRHGTEEHVEMWCRDGLTAVTNVPTMWNIGVLTDEAQDLDVGIVTRSSVHDLKLHETNSAFFAQTEFVVLLEPSRLLTTAQIGLNSLVRLCRRENKRMVFCSVDKNCDGLLDSLSHVLMTSLREVSATNHHQGTSSYMCWEADSECLQHRMLPNLSRYLGMGTELSLVALKNQVSQTAWYGGDAFPVVDMRWIAKQYYYDLLHYANLPATQETMETYFETSPDLWSARVQKNQYLTVEDESFNMFEVKRAFATRASEQGFINVLSPEYLLKDYMAVNDGIFNADAKAIPYVTADYARTARNVALRLCLRMSAGLVPEADLHRELLIIDRDSAHPEKSLWQVVCENFQNLGQRSLNLDSEDILRCKTARGTVEFTADVIRMKRRFSLETGKMENTYFISDAQLIALLLNDLQSAEYIAEDENETKQYLGAELRGHVFQKYLPGQFFTLSGKYYEMLRVTAEGQVLLRRAADHIDGRPSYRQVRRYILSGVADSETMGDRRDLGTMCIAKQYADIRVETPAYWELDHYNDFAHGRKISLNGVPVRCYHNKQLLRIDFRCEDGGDTPEICRTLALLFNEVLRTLFAENQDYLVAVAAGDAEAPLTYSLSGENGFAPSPNSIYILEDSQLDVGLLVAVERNLDFIFSIICDYLEWNEQSIELSRNPPPEPNPPDFAVTPDEDGAKPKHGNLFRRIGAFFRNTGRKIADFFRKLFRRKPKAPSDDLPPEEPAADTPEEPAAEAVPETSPAAGTEENPADEAPLEPASETPEPEPETLEPETSEPEVEPPLMNCSVLFDETPNAENGDQLDFEQEQVMKPSAVPVRKPYYERYYLLYGGTEMPAQLDLAGTQSLLQALGYGNSALKQAREGKNVAEQLERSFVPNRPGCHYCDFCGSELLGMEYDILADGRERCMCCGRTAVKTQEEFAAIHESVIRNMKAFYGVKITAPVRIQMVNAKKLHRKLGKSFIPTGKADGRVLGVAIRDKTGYSILMENGAPRMQSTMTMVHELTHIWQYLNWDAKDILRTYGKGQNLEVYEGMAKWSEIQYAYLINETAAAKREEIITRARDDAYGKGFVKYAAKYRLRTGPGAGGPTPFDDRKIPL